MQAALLTIGDEILAGDIENTNATWLTTQLTERGVTTERILVIPDERSLIARKVSEYADAFDAVIITGGLGGTHDDVTMDAVADAFGVAREMDPAARKAVEETIEAARERIPDLDIDLEAHAALPAGGQAIHNEEGLAPGCVIENVYVFPGIPREMHPMFASVAEAFAGDSQFRFVHTTTPEGKYTPMLTDARDRYPDLAFGSYPSGSDGEWHNRIKITGEDDERLAEATDWIEARVETDDAAPDAD
jgi:nicotinamide-nucleotide amidase